MNETDDVEPASPPVGSAEPLVPAEGPPAVPTSRGMPAGAIDTTTQTLERLRQRHLLVPVSGISAAALVESYEDTRRGTARHEALDIPAPRGTPVLAADEGRVAKLFTSKLGGLAIYQFDREERVAFYYAHLDRYAEGLKEGDEVTRGALLGYVGSTGNAAPDAPHLHFAVFVLGPEKRWWQGSPLDPFKIWR